MEWGIGERERGERGDILERSGTEGVETDVFAGVDDGEFAGEG